MKCPRCLNEDPSYFYRGHKGVYCRKCISFSRVMTEEELETPALSRISAGASEYAFVYPLTADQKKISSLCAQYIEHSDVLLKCVCGAGKTEMTVETIAMFLRRGQKVCFAIARRQVVLEVAQRLQSYFKDARVIAVCGGHTQVTDGDLIVCTTHQLYRYYQAFDCLILDEPDAFPFRGSDVLHGIAKTSCRGHTVYLTATPDEELKQRVKDKTLVCLSLNRRPHGKPLPVPKIITAPSMILFVILLRWIVMHEHHPRIVFVPTIRMAKMLHMFLSIYVDCDICTSKTDNRDEVIDQFRKKKAGLIVATTVLERGVTIKDCDVCVFAAEHSVFDEAGLIQMAGRAGRNFENPYGDVLFLCREKSDLVIQCRDEIEEANHAVSVV